MLDDIVPIEYGCPVGVVSTSTQTAASRPPRMALKPGGLETRERHKVPADRDRPAHPAHVPTSARTGSTLLDLATSRAFRSPASIN